MKPIIILVEPQLGDNIGLAARAMGNFGLRDLRLVNPRDGWPNPKALSAAAAAHGIIESAQVYPTLAQALEGVGALYATSARPRFLEKRIISPSLFQKEVGGKPVPAIMFGCERTGLSNHDMALADCIIEIPTDPRCPSINLAHAVFAIAYHTSQSPIEDLETLPSEAASPEAFAHLMMHLEARLGEKGYFYPEAKKRIWFKT